MIFVNKQYQISLVKKTTKASKKINLKALIYIIKTLIFLLEMLKILKIQCSFSFSKYL